jgi:hypothetical protein
VGHHFCQGINEGRFEASKPTHLKLIFLTAHESLDCIYNRSRGVPLGEYRLVKIWVHDMLDTPGVGILAVERDHFPTVQR